MKLAFDLICSECGEKAELRGGYESSGMVVPSRISLDFDIDEDDPSDTRLKIYCYKCGNSFDITN